MTHTWSLWDVPDEWMTVYDNGRIVTIRSISIQELNGRYRFDLGTTARIETVVGSTSMAGEVGGWTGSPLMQDNAVGAARLAATEAGDLSWSEPVVIEPPGRDRYSVSVFLPPDVDRAAIEACGIIYDDSGQPHPDAPFTWFRPLAADLIPDLASELGQRHTEIGEKWGGVGDWEILADEPELLGGALAALAERHDLVFITADRQFYDIDRLNWRIANEGLEWEVGWSRWTYGYEDLDDYDAPPPEPYRAQRPGPELTGDHAEWAVIYDDGCVVFIHADTVEQVGRYLRFDAATVDADSFNLGWVSAEGATVFRGAPRLTDNPEAVAALTAVHWGQDPDQGLADTDIGSPPRISPPPRD